MQYVKNVNLFGEIVDIGIEDGKFAFIGKTDEEGRDFGGAKILPGLVDMHSHGVKGKDADDAELEMMARFYLENGTTTWYPTTTTVSFESIINSCKSKTDLRSALTFPVFTLKGRLSTKNTVARRTISSQKIPTSPCLTLARRQKS